MKFRNFSLKHVMKISFHVSNSVACRRDLRGGGGHRGTIFGPPYNVLNHVYDVLAGLLDFTLKNERPRYNRTWIVRVSVYLAWCNVLWYCSVLGACICILNFGVYCRDRTRTVLIFWRIDFKFGIPSEPGAWSLNAFRHN